MQLTAGEECQLSAKILSSFADPRQGAITAPFINSGMGLAIFKGDIGVAVVRLKSGDWSAPCAIKCKSRQGEVQPAQEMVLLFMSENAIFSLVGQTTFVFNQTHKFAPGPLYGSTLNIDKSVDVYCYVRFNNGFTPSELISHHMAGWSVDEDPLRHTKWHGKNATWFDVLTNKISVDRSSVGNALYLVLNLASCGGNATGKNYASIEEWAKSTSTASNNTVNIAQRQSQFLPQQQYHSQQMTQQHPHHMNQFDAQTIYQMQLKAQEQMMQQAQLQQGYNEMLQQQPPVNFQYQQQQIQGIHINNQTQDANQQQFPNHQQQQFPNQEGFYNNQYNSQF